MQKRNYGIDALRMIAMLMVVVYHMIHREILSVITDDHVLFGAAWAIDLACFCAVDCFGIISGYVGVKGKYRPAKVLEMWLLVVFYLAGYWLVGGALFPDAISFSKWKQGFMPVSGQIYWYYTAYFCVSLLSPILNAALLALSRREAAMVTGGMLLMFSIMANYSPAGDPFELKGGYSVLWLIALYVIGGYMRLHGDKDRIVRLFRRYGLGLYLLFAAALWMMVIGRWWLFGGENRLNLDAATTYTYPLVAGCAIALAARCSCWKPGKRLSRMIAWLSPSAFSVYLIHTHPDSWAWITIIREKLSFSEQIGVQSIAKVMLMSVCIYLICMAIDLVRRALFACLHVAGGCDLATSFLSRWMNGND